jgi:hypothetical protein
LNKENKKKNEPVIKLKKNWISQNDSFGIEYYLCVETGQTTYDLKMALDDTTYEEKESVNFFKLNQDFNYLNNNIKLDIHKNLLEKNVLIKWRHKEEYLNQVKCLDNFDSISTTKIDRNIFKDLQVR